MAWNYLNSVLEKLSAELLLLGVSLLWVLLRLLSAVGRRVEKGKPLVIKLFGRNFVEVKGENLNSAVKHIAKNT